MIFGSDSQDAQRALPRYYGILEGKRKARFLSCKNLADKIDSAREIMKSCCLCERRCRVNRLSGERGFCRVFKPRIASEFIHLGEEPELVPSYTIFFAGCTFSCVFCQNSDISQHPENGRIIPSEEMAGMIEKKSARNVNWVGGDPTPNLAYVLEVLSHLEKNIPQVWNSNMYLTEESMSLLDGVIDVYLTDFKYGNDECAKKLSKAPGYWKTITRNHLEAGKQCEVIVRHLVLPGHFECCSRPVLDWISGNIPDARVNVMDQYRPEYKAFEYHELGRRLSREEFQGAWDYARELGLDLVR